MLHKVFISVLFLLCTSILFANEEAQQYFNNSKSIVFELDGNWNIAGNMKGIEIFIDQELENGNKRVITASKEEGLLLGISLSAYTASKIGLQLSVLEAQIVESDDIKVNGLNGKSIVYNYLNDDLETLSTRVVIVLKDQVAYQITATCSKSDYEKSKVLFNQLFNTLKIN